METTAEPIIKSIDSLADVARQSEQQLRESIQIIKRRDAIIEIAIEALLVLAQQGDITAGQALLEMRALHNKPL